MMKYVAFSLIILGYLVCFRPILGTSDPLMEAMQFIQDLESDEHGGQLSIQQSSTLIETLWERSGCTEILGDKCNDCLSVETLFQIIEANKSEGLTDATYPKASVVLTYFLYSFNEVCQTAPILHNYTWYLADVMSMASGLGVASEGASNVLSVYQEINPASEVYLTENGLSYILKLINKTYTPLSKVKCFYANTLFQDADVDSKLGADESQTQSICAHMITNLLQGDLIGESMYIQPNAFIDEIYSDYGDGDKITPEGFEEIMTSLGIGDHSHTEETEETEELEETHSHEHTIHECLSSEELLDIFEVAVDAGIDKSQFQVMCPSLIQQLLNNSCAEHDDTHSDERPSNLEVYGWGTLSVLLISLLSLLGAATIPLLNTTAYENLIQLFIALAIGTMSGDAFLHLMPEALGLHSHDGEEESTESSVDYLWKNLTVVVSLYVFFLFEKLTSSLLGGHSHSHSHSNRVHDKTEEKTEFSKTNEGFIIDNTLTEVGDEKTKTQEKTEFSKTNEGFIDSTLTEVDDERIKAENIDIEESRRQSTSALIDDKNGGVNSLNAMVLIGDGIHNLMDGLAIGVAFTADTLVGVSTSIAVLFHELPHELGDFAVLVNNGLSVPKALLCNFVSACMAFVGLYIGIAAGDGTAVHQWVFAVTAGMFIYVSLVDLMPELDHKNSKNPRLTFLLQNLGLCIGWGLMVLIANFEGAFSLGGDEHDHEH